MASTLNKVRVTAVEYREGVVKEWLMVTASRGLTTVTFAVPLHKAKSYLIGKEIEVRTSTK